MDKFHWPDARGWIGISVFALTVMVLWMVAVFPELRHDEFFKVLATAIVLTGFTQGVVGWAYSASKQGGELAERNASIVEQSATATVANNSTTGTGPAANQVREGAREGTREGVAQGLDDAGIAPEPQADLPGYAQ
jgi:hypothetical protein